MIGDCPMTGAERVRRHRAWRRAAQNGIVIDTAPPTAAAQIAALTAKRELLEHEIEQDEASYIDRAQMVELWEWEAIAVQARLLTLPARYADQVSATLGCSWLCARRILEQLVHLLLKELNGLEDQVRDAVERLH